MDNKNEAPKTINDINNPPIMNTNDTIEVNNLVSLSNSDIPLDLLEQLEKKAKEEQEKLDLLEATIPKDEVVETQEDIHISEGLPAENGAVNITADILERPMPENSDVVEKPEEVLEVNIQETLDPLEEAKYNAVYKKYVIYINKENEHFIDSLSISERKKLINNVLFEQNLLSEAQRREKKKKENTVKMLISLVTFLVAVPFIYFIFNISLVATIQNYKDSKTNFEVLYKETGKIKIDK